MKRVFESLGAIAVACVSLMSLFSPPAHAAADCDRACLGNIVTQYLDALVEHAPAKLPMSSSVKFTEDSIQLKPGEGFWRTAVKPTKSVSLRPETPPYRLDVLDASQSTAVTFVKLEENGAPVLHVARLKVVDRKVTELETTVVRSRDEGGRIFDPEMLLHATDEMTRVLASADIVPRNEAIKIAERYPAGLRAGSFVTAGVPFAADAYRLENGRIMAGRGCTFAEGCGDIKTQKIPTYPSGYRVIAVDEPMGIVILRQNFGPRPYDNRIELHTWHAFKIYRNQIHAVEAFQKVQPTGTNFGWE